MRKLLLFLFWLCSLASAQEKAVEVSGVKHSFRSTTIRIPDLV